MHGSQRFSCTAQSLEVKIFLCASGSLGRKWSVWLHCQNSTLHDVVTFLWTSGQCMSVLFVICLGGQSRWLHRSKWVRFLGCLKEDLAICVTCCYHRFTSQLPSTVFLNESNDMVFHVQAKCRTSGMSKIERHAETRRSLFVEATAFTKGRRVTVVEPLSRAFGSCEWPLNRQCRFLNWPGIVSVQFRLTQGSDALFSFQVCQRCQATPAWSRFVAGSFACSRNHMFGSMFLETSFCRRVRFSQVTERHIRWICGG